MAAWVGGKDMFLPQGAAGCGGCGNSIGCHGLQRANGIRKAGVGVPNGAS